MRVRTVLLVIALVFPLLAVPAMAAPRRSNPALSVQARRLLDASDIDAIQVLELNFLRDQMTKAKVALRASLEEKRELNLKHKEEIEKREEAQKASDEKVLTTLQELLRLQNEIRRLTLNCVELDQLSTRQKQSIDDLVALSTLLAQLCSGLRQEIHHLTQGATLIVR